MRGEAELDGATLAEFAKEADISPNNAGVRLHRARRALKARLSEACASCADHGCDPCACRPRHVEADTGTPAPTARPPV